MLSSLALRLFLKKNLNASRPSEHPLVIRGKKCQNVYLVHSWDHRLQRQNLLMPFNRVPQWYLVTLGQQYHVGENPTVILYTYINRYAGKPDKTKTKATMRLDYSLLHIYGLG